MFLEAPMPQVEGVGPDSALSMIRWDSCSEFLDERVPGSGMRDYTPALIQGVNPYVQEIYEDGSNADYEIVAFVSTFNCLSFLKEDSTAVPLGLTGSISGVLRTSVPVTALLTLKRTGEVLATVETLGVLDIQSESGRALYWSVGKTRSGKTFEAARSAVREAGARLGNVIAAIHQEMTQGPK